MSNRRVREELERIKHTPEETLLHQLVRLLIDELRRRLELCAQQSPASRCQAVLARRWPGMNSPSVLEACRGALEIKFTCNSQRKTVVYFTVRVSGGETKEEGFATCCKKDGALEEMLVWLSEASSVCDSVSTFQQLMAALMKNPYESPFYD